MKKYLKSAIDKLKLSYNYHLLSKAWSKRHEKVKTTIDNFQLSPSMNEHNNRWQSLHSKFSSDTLNVCFSISGEDNIDYVPEEIFEGVIERCIQAHFDNAYNLFSQWLGLDLPDELLVPKQTADPELVTYCKERLASWGVGEKDFVLMQLMVSNYFEFENFNMSV